MDESDLKERNTCSPSSYCQPQKAFDYNAAGEDSYLKRRLTCLVTTAICKCRSAAHRIIFAPLSQYPYFVKATLWIGLNFEEKKLFFKNISCLKSRILVITGTLISFVWSKCLFFLSFPMRQPYIILLHNFWRQNSNLRYIRPRKSQYAFVCNMFGKACDFVSHLLCTCTHCVVQGWGLVYVISFQNDM